MRLIKKCNECSLMIRFIKKCNECSLIIRFIKKCNECSLIIRFIKTCNGCSLMIRFIKKCNECFQFISLWFFFFFLFHQLASFSFSFHLLHPQRHNPLHAFFLLMLLIKELDILHVFFVFDMLLYSHFLLGGHICSNHISLACHNDLL